MSNEKTEFVNVRYVMDDGGIESGHVENTFYF